MISISLWLPSERSFDLNKFVSTFGSTPISHKYWEFEVMYSNWTNLFRFELSFSRKTDHAGVHFSIGLFGFELDFQIYDHRHWDYVNDRWEDHEDDNGN